jgi:mannose-6-phosphate isomerase-like protein (cupin superfamily)
MTRTQKVWGEHWCVRQDSTHAVSYLELLPWKRCSWHTHQQKYNKFVVVKGVVGIKTHEGEIVLKRGDSCTVPPGVPHEFRTYDTHSAMIEEMYVVYDESDIERMVVGGAWDKGDSSG